MSRIDRAIGAIREDRRADYLFDTRMVATALRVHPNKFHARWYRTRDWLIELGAVSPGELAAELAAIVAKAVELKERRASGQPLHVKNHGGT